MSLRKAAVTAAISCLLVAGAEAQDGDGEIPAHTSVGSPQDGHLAGGGFELPLEGRGFHWATNRQNRGARFGTPALVNALMRAAGIVADGFEGSDLEIEDISFEAGGRIDGHGSHRSGRDVDVTYYALTAEGARSDPTTSVWFTRRGFARGVRRSHARRFDAERNWLFVSSLLTDETISVQYIFMHGALQTLMLEEAEVEQGPALELARSVLRVPRGRRMDPHMDHLHVRIHCPEADLGHGCFDGNRRSRRRGRSRR